MRKIRRGYVSAGGRTVHYRICGQGPAVVMLHDSPRSSRLHLGTMAALGDSFTVFALDTPGYGNSQPLGIPEPSIADFADALGKALDALGLADAPLYATHTSAKIALCLAVRAGRIPLLVLDGLSLPETLAPAEFVEAYMRPFRIDDAGGYLAAEWSRTRDMLRWFPWFTPTPSARMAMEPPSAEWMADYGVDLMNAGPHYSDAYAAAMRWNPMPDLLAVKVPTVVAAKADDVLCGYLDRVPLDRNPALTVERLTADRTEWLGWLRRTLAAAVATTPLPRLDPPCADAGYLDLPHGQLHWQRQGTGEPIVVLSAPTTLQALCWAEALAASRTVLVPDLPGFADSDPLPAPDADGLADAVAALIAEQAGGRATVLAIGLAAPLGARLATRHPQAVSWLVVDGAPPLDPDHAARFGAELCPEIEFDPLSGGHLHRIWHILRDGEVQWPWHDPAPAAARRLPPQVGGAALHAALTGVLKQPRDWGQAAAASLAAAPPATWSGLWVPVTVFVHADPAFAEAAAIAALCGGENIDRPDDLAAAARLIAPEQVSRQHGKSRHG